MNRWMALVAIVYGSTAISVETSQAGPVPQELYNKTITMTWNLQISVRNAGGAVSTFVASRERVVYISDKGRLFVREVRTNRRGRLNQIEERAPSESTNFTGNPSSIRFEGKQLVAITGQVSGANMMRASFDPSFSSCSITWMAGKSISGHTIWKGTDGRNYDILSATAGALSCNVRAGNAFAN